MASETWVADVPSLTPFKSRSGSNPFNPFLTDNAPVVEGEGARPVSVRMEGGIAGGAAGGAGCVGPASDSQSTVDDGSGVSPCVSEADIGLMMPGDGGDRGDFSPRDHSKVRHTPHTVALSKAAATLCEVSGCCCRSNWCQIQRVFCVLTAACVIDDVPLIPAPISQLSGHLYSPPPHPLAILIHSPSSSTRHPHQIVILIKLLPLRYCRIRCTCPRPSRSCWTGGRSSGRTSTPPRHRGMYFFLVFMLAVDKVEPPMYFFIATPSTALALPRYRRNGH